MIIGDVHLESLYAYRTGPYLISTLSAETYMTGIGEWTIAHGDWGTDASRVTLTSVGRAWTLASAVSIVREHEERTRG